MVHSGFSEMTVQWAFQKGQHEPMDFWGTAFVLISDKKVQKKRKILRYTKFKKKLSQIH